MLGLNPYQTKTTSLLQALGISLISESTNIHSLDLLRQCLLSESNTKRFFCYMMTQSSFNNNTLVGRVKKFAVDKNINLLQYVFNDSYRSHVKKASLKSRPKSSGLIDSIRFIINNYYQSNMEILKILLKAF